MPVANLTAPVETATPLSALGSFLGGSSMDELAKELNLTTNERVTVATTSETISLAIVSSASLSIAASVAAPVAASIAATAATAVGSAATGAAAAAATSAAAGATGAAAAGAGGAGNLASAAGGGAMSPILFAAQRFATTQGMGVKTSKLQKGVATQLGWVSGKFNHLSAEDIEGSIVGLRRRLERTQQNIGNATSVPEATHVPDELVELINTLLTFVLAIGLTFVLQLSIVFVWRHLVNRRYYAALRAREALTNAPNDQAKIKEAGFTPFPKSLVFPTPLFFTSFVFATGLARASVKVLAVHPDDCGPLCIVLPTTTMAVLAVILGCAISEVLMQERKYGNLVKWNAAPRKDHPKAVADPYMELRARARVELLTLQLSSKVRTHSRRAKAASLGSASQPPVPTSSQSSITEASASQKPLPPSSNRSVILEALAHGLVSDETCTANSAQSSASQAFASLKAGEVQGKTLEQRTTKPHSPHRLTPGRRCRVRCVDSNLVQTNAGATPDAPPSPPSPTAPRGTQGAENALRERSSFKVRRMADPPSFTAIVGGTAEGILEAGNISGRQRTGTGAGIGTSQKTVTGGSFVKHDSCGRKGSLSTGTKRRTQRPTQGETEAESPPSVRPVSREAPRPTDEPPDLEERSVEQIDFEHIGRLHEDSLKLPTLGSFSTSGASSRARHSSPPAKRVSATRKEGFAGSFTKSFSESFKKAIGVGASPRSSCSSSILSQAFSGGLQGHRSRVPACDDVSAEGNAATALRPPSTLERGPSYVQSRIKLAKPLTVARLNLQPTTLQDLPPGAPPALAEIHRLQSTKHKTQSSLISSPEAGTSSALGQPAREEMCGEKAATKQAVGDMPHLDVSDSSVQAHTIGIDSPGAPHSSSTQQTGAGGAASTTDEQLAAKGEQMSPTDEVAARRRTSCFNRSPRRASSVASQDGTSVASVANATAATHRLSLQRNRRMSVLDMEAERIATEARTRMVQEQEKALGDEVESDAANISQKASRRLSMSTAARMTLFTRSAECAQSGSASAGRAPTLRAPPRLKRMKSFKISRNEIRERAIEIIGREGGHRDRKSGAYALPEGDVKEPERTERLLKSPLAFRGGIAADAYHSREGYLLFRINGASPWGRWYRVILIFANVSLGVASGLQPLCPEDSLQGIMQAGLILLLQYALAFICCRFLPDADRIFSRFAGTQFFLEGVSSTLLVAASIGRKAGISEEHLDGLLNTAFVLSISAICVPMTQLIEQRLLTPSIGIVRKGTCNPVVIFASLYMVAMTLPAQLKKLIALIAGKADSGGGGSGDGHSSGDAKSSDAVGSDVEAGEGQGEGAAPSEEGGDASSSEPAVSAGNVGTVLSKVSVLGARLLAAKEVDAKKIKAQDPVREEEDETKYEPGPEGQARRFVDRLNKRRKKRKQAEEEVDDDGADGGAD